MSMFFIRVRGAAFRSTDLGADYERPEAALALGIQGAIGMLTDDLYLGQPNAAIEVSIEAEDGTQLLCSVVTVSVTPLLPRGLAERADETCR